MKKVIFTADDYGAIPAIDAGVCKAVGEGKINSVATFANTERAIESVRTLLNFAEKAERKLDIGCHLTLSSGSPVKPHAGLRWMLDRRGNFRSFLGHRCPRPRTEALDIRSMMEQLHRQVDVFERAGIEIKHLSIHHGLLYWSDVYLRAYLQVARERGIAARSPYVVPEADNLRYLRAVGSTMRWNNNADFNASFEDRIRDYAKTTAAVLSSFKELILPSYSNILHYGPPPFIRSNVRRNEQRVDALASEKRTALSAAIAAQPGNAVVEYLFHLIDDDFDNLRSYTLQYNSGTKAYGGVDRRYFAWRMAEQRSLRSFSLPQNAALHDWKNL